jgi:hypothetical protein
VLFLETHKDGGVPPSLIARRWCSAGELGTRTRSRRCYRSHSTPAIRQIRAFSMATTQSQSWGGAARIMRSLRKIGVCALSIVLMSALGIVLFLRREKVIERRKLSDTADQCHRLAEWGDANREFDLARMYFEGKGVTKDYAQALQWYRKAAEQGHIKARPVRAAATAVLTSSSIRDPNRQRGFPNIAVSRLSMSAYSECP